MAIVPEIILQRAIITGIQGIRKDPRIINMLFKNLPIDQQENIKSYILDKTIDFSLNYPRSEIKVPAIILLMKNESEAHTFLGDITGSPPNYDMPDDDMAMETLGGSTAASTSSMSGLPPKVLGGLRVVSQVSVTSSPSGSSDHSGLTFLEADQDLIDEVFSQKSSWPSLTLHVIAGAGIGQTKMISAISSSRLDIIGTFGVNCDSTSIVDIRYSEDPEAAYGQPVRAYEVGDTSQLRIGANYDGQYQLEVLAGNQEEVIYLYTVLKAILFAQRTFLEAQGIMSLKISGTDLAPRSELLPDEIFTRSMTLMFTYPFDFIVEQEVARAIQISLTPSTVVGGPEPGIYGETIIFAEVDLSV